MELAQYIVSGTFALSDKSRHIEKLIGSNAKELYRNLAVYFENTNYL